MEVIFILVPVSLAIIVGAIWAFVWSVRNNQFEDLEKEGHSILFENELGQRKGARDEGARDEEKRRAQS